MNKVRAALIAGLAGASIGGLLVWLLLGGGADQQDAGGTRSPAGATARDGHSAGGQDTKAPSSNLGTTESEAALVEADQALPTSPAGEAPGPGAVSSVSTPPPPQLAQLPRQAASLDDVVVPVPSEVFAVLAKSAQPVWRDVMRTPGPETRATGSREQLALLLGTVIAEGFVAVEAENTPAVQEIGRTVLVLSEGLGVRTAVLRRSAAIVELAEQKKWADVRHELDGALLDVRSAMVRLENVSLAQLVSLGGWLRGTEALSGIVAREFTPESAELLHQPGLIDYFASRIAAMPPNMKDDPLIHTMQQGLAEIRTLMGENSAAIAAAQVSQISGTTARLVKSISSGVQ